MNDSNFSESNWAGPVLNDLAKALHRDGMHKTAEILEDAFMVLAEEYSTHRPSQLNQLPLGGTQLKLVVP